MDFQAISPPPPMAPPSLYHGPHSHRHHLSPPAPWLHLGGAPPWSPSHWTSPYPCITSVGWAQIYTMATPSISSTMGHLPPGCLLGHSGHLSAVRSFMDPSTVHSSMGPFTISFSLPSATVYSTLVSQVSISACFEHYASSSSTSRAPILPPSVKLLRHKIATHVRHTFNLCIQVLNFIQFFVWYCLCVVFYILVR